MTPCRNLLLPALLILASTGTAQWASLASIPTTPFNGGFSFSIGNTIFVGNGSEGRDLFAFDTGTGTWSSKADLPGSGTQCFAAIAFAIDGYGYVGLGFNGTADQPALWRYDPLADQWSARASFPGTARSEAAVFVIGAKAYISGGAQYLGDTFDDLYVYDSVSDAWNMLGQIPLGPRSNATAFALNGKGYLLGGGVLSGGDTDLAFQYDPLTSSWDQLPNFPGGPRESMVAFTHGGTATVGMGHFELTSYYTDFYEFDPQSESWSPGVSEFPSDPRWSPIAASVNGAMYVGTGFSLTNFNANNDWWVNDTYVSVDEQRARSSEALRIVNTLADNELEIVTTGAGVLRVFDSMGHYISEHAVGKGRVGVPLSGVAPGCYRVTWSDGLAALATASFVKY